jgi:hypothetical protein
MTVDSAREERRIIYSSKSASLNRAGMRGA